MNQKPEPTQLEECRMLKENIMDLKGTVWRLKCKLAQEEINYKRELRSKTDAVLRMNLKLDCVVLSLKRTCFDFRPPA